MWLASTILDNTALETDKPDQSVSEGDEHLGEVGAGEGTQCSCACGACALCAVFNRVVMGTARGIQVKAWR